MKDSTPVLYPNSAVGARVAAYSADRSTPLPAHVAGYHARIRDSHPAANMMVSESQAQAMVFLARMVGAKRVLEVGVYVGLSSLVWSHAVGPDGAVTGLEFDPEYARLAREAFAEHGVRNAEVVVGDALESLPALNPPEPYDIIFIDANKPGYPAYLESILSLSPSSTTTPKPPRLLRPGGLIIGDNALRSSFVADTSPENPWRQWGGWSRPEYWESEDIHALRRFNDDVAGSARLENLLVPLWDGLNVARLVD